MTDALNNFIGQENAKKTLKFYLEAQNKTGFIQPLLFSARRGAGKTTLCRLIADNLVDVETGQRKPILEVNGASIKKLRTFVDSIVAPYLGNGQSVTLILDELHSVNSEVKDWFLSVLQPNETNITQARFKDEVYEFDFRKFSLLASTTNAELLSKPLLSRLKRIELENYSKPELVKILDKNTPDILIEDNVKEEVASVIRASPREIVKIAQDIKQFCANYNVEIFGSNDWSKLRNILNIKPLGLSPLEIDHMRILKEHGPQTLTVVGSKLGLDVSAVRKDVEQFLLSENLIGIDGKRYLTPRGHEILKLC